MAGAFAPVKAMGQFRRMSVLQRKAQAGRQEHQARAMTVPKSLRLSIAKVADELWSMAIAAIAITYETRNAEAVSPEFDEGNLLLHLDGPNGATGAAVVGRELVSALVQQQTIGRVSPQPVPDRALTSTDAALCAPLLDRVFARANGMLETDEDRRVLPGFKYGAHCDNARLLTLALEEPEYTVISITVDIAGGAHQSTLKFVLPLVKVQEKITEKGDANSPTSGGTLEAVAMTLKTELRAILCKVRVPVSQIGSLRPGMALDLPPDAFPEVRVEALDGRVLAKGELGQVEGKRALRLEHRNPGRHAPKRRMSDQSDLDLPQVDVASMPGGDLIDMDLSMPAHDDVSSLGDLPDIEMPDISTPESIESEIAMAGDGLGDLPDLDNLPDLSDLPELDDLADLSDLPDLPDLNTA